MVLRNSEEVLRGRLLHILDQKVGQQRTEESPTHALQNQRRDDIRNKNLLLKVVQKLLNNKTQQDSFSKEPLPAKDS